MPVKRANNWKIFTGMWLLCVVALPAQILNPLAGVVAQEAIVQSLEGKWLCSLDENQWFEYHLPFVDTLNRQWWCKKTIRLTKEQIHNYQWELVGIGAGYEVKCYVNGQYVGVHFGYWLPFRFSLPANLLREGKNELMIVVANQRDPENTLPLQGTPYEVAIAGGVFRPLYLVGRPQVALSNFTYRTSFAANNQTATVELLLTLQTGAIKDPDSVAIIARIQPLGDSAAVTRARQLTTVRANREERVTLTLTIPQPKRWSPEHPNRYRVIVQIQRSGQPEATYTRSIGLWEWEVRGKQLLLNGKPWRWRGVDYVAVPRGNAQQQHFRQLVERVKMLGCNVLRFRHFAPDLELVQICEEMGLFVTVELPVSHVPSALLGRESFRNNVRYLMQTLVAWYDASPAVFGWGIAEALPEATAEAQEYQQYAAATFRQLSTKPVYKVAWWMGKDTIQAASMDLVLLFTAWQSPARSQSLVEQAELLPCPVIGYCGTVFQSGNHRGYADPLSEEAQAKYLKEWLEVFQRNAPFQGEHIWAFVDYPVAQPTVLVPATKVLAVGLLDPAGRQRLSFEVVKALINNEQLPLIPAGKKEQQWDFVFPVSSVLSLFLVFILLNRSRRFQENFVRALTKSFNFYADIRDQRIIPLPHTLVLLIALSLGVGTFEAALYFYLKSDFRFDWFVDLFFPQPMVKYTVAYLLWNPVELIAVCAVGWILSFLGIALLARGLAVFVESKIFFRDTLNVTTWSALPYLIAAVGGMGIYSGFLAGVPAAVAVWVLLGLTLWFFMRSMKGFAVVFDLWPPYVHTVALAILVLLLTIWGVWYDFQWGLFTRLQYWIETF